MPDKNQNLIIRVLLSIFAAMFIANTVAQFLQINYKEPFYLSTWLLPLLGVVIYAYYKDKEVTLKKLMVVEDHDAWRTIISLCLHERYKITFFKTGEDALAFLQSCPSYELPDKAIIDKKLPGMDGVDLIKRIYDMGLDIDPIILSASEPDLNSPDRDFADMWLLKSPAVVKASGDNIITALEDKKFVISIKSIKKLLIKLLPHKKD